MNVTTLPLDKLIPYARNPRKNAGAVATVKASLQEFGWQQPIVIDEKNVILAGHTRYLAALELGWTDAPVQIAKDLTPAQAKAYRLMDNKSHERAEWDRELLALEIDDLKEMEFDLDLTGFDADELAGIDLNSEPEPEGDTEPGEPRQTMSDRFGIPPFSVLNAREGWWQDRKKAWIALGIQSELGRGAAPGAQDGGADMDIAANQRKWIELLPQPNAAPGGSLMPAMDYRNRQRGDGRGRPL